MSVKVKFIERVSVASLLEDGYWEIISSLTEGARDAGDTEYDKRTISVKTLDRDFERAVDTADHAIEARYAQAGFNLLSIPKEEDGTRVSIPT